MSPPIARLNRLIRAAVPFAEALRTVADELVGPIRGGRALGPQSSDVYEALRRLDSLGPADIVKPWAIADQLLFDMKPRFGAYTLRRALVATQQPAEGFLVLVERGPHLQPFPGRLAMGPSGIDWSVRAILGAHLLSPQLFREWTAPLRALVGEVAYPASALTAAVPGCTRPVGAHLLPTEFTAFSCGCRLPGLSRIGTDIARSLAPESADWPALLEVARLLDPMST